MADQLTYDQQLARFMAAIRSEESGGNYRTGPNRSGASGAYQFIDSTWRSNAGPYARLYPQAWMAPPEIQDEVARQVMGGYFRAFGNWSDVAKAWLGGAGSIHKVVSDGNITNVAYAAKVLRMAGLDGGPGVMDMSYAGGAGGGGGGPGEVGTTDTSMATGPDYGSVDVQVQTILGLLGRPGQQSLSDPLENGQGPSMPGATDQSNQPTAPGDEIPATLATPTADVTDAAATGRDNYKQPVKGLI